jgi:hypothetical protein
MSMTPRDLAEHLLAATTTYDQTARVGDTLIVQVLIDGRWYNVERVDTMQFSDSGNRSNVVALRGVPA